MQKFIASSQLPALGAGLALLGLVVLPPFSLSAQEVKGTEPNRGGDISTEARDPNVAKQFLFPAEGYEVSLYASEKEFPLLANPVALNFDGRGRLYVCTMPSYPQRLPDEDPDDKIIVLEDVNADGKADTCVTYIDKLHVPTGFELGDGGAYIAQQPDLIFAKDTDGDGRADLRQTVLHGFGTEDSHHSISAFTWGPDGGLYFQEGTFHHSQVETPYGPVRLVDAGVFRYKPSQHYLEVFVTYGFANPWGHVFDKWGQNFIADASGGANYFGLPITGYKPYPKKSGGMKVFTSVVRPTAGCEFVSSRHFPDEVQGDFLINNCIGFQGIKQHRVIEEDSGYTSEEREPLLYSSDINFRPVDLEFGPDGALYIVDWFNPLIGHMQYSLRDEGRDHSHGRIWRITYKHKPLIEPTHTEGKSIAELLEALKVYEDRTRYRARMELRRHDADEVSAALDVWTKALDASDPNHEHQLLEALWVKQTINKPDAALLDRVLASSEPRARAAAVRVARHWRREVDGVMDRLEKAVEDEFPRTRLEAVTALSYMDSWEAQRAVIKARALPTDYYLDYGLNESTNALEQHWKPAVLAGKISLDEDTSVGEFLAGRMSADELAQILDSQVALKQVLTRPGASDASRRAALAKLAEEFGGDKAAAWIEAVKRLDAGSASEKPATLEQYARLLLELSADELRPHEQEWDSLALEGSTSRMKQAALVALMRAQGSVDRAWKLAETDGAVLMNLLAVAGELRDDTLRKALYPHVRGLLGPNGEVTVEGSPIKPGARFVRIELPGERRVLTVAELEVYSNRENVARTGSATQSSTMHGGVAARAIDGNSSAEFNAGGQTHTNEEANPWLEVDLGKAYPIDFIRVLNRRDGDMGDRLDGFRLTVLDENRIPVFSKDDIPGKTRSVRVDITTDPAGALRRAALPALAHLDTGEGDTLSMLTGAFANEAERALAARALMDLSPAAWRPDALGKLIQPLGDYAAAASPEDLASPGLQATFAAGERLAALLPITEASALKQRLAVNQLQVRRLSAIPHKMQYDATQILVRAGAPVEIILSNPDIMPHNLVIGVPGSLEEIGLASDAESTSAEAAERDYVPVLPSVLHSTKLVQPGKEATIRFVAPTEPGEYPFLCTYPGHWRVMQGTLHVMEELPIALASGGGKFVQLWSRAELTPAVDYVAQIAPERGKALFDSASCSQCHSDGRLAPSLESLRSSFYPKSLVAAIVAPADHIAPEYRTVRVTLRDDRVYKGQIAGEDDERILIRQNLLQPEFVVTVDKSEMLSMEVAPESMMPEHLLAGLTQEEIYALMAYILDSPAKELASATSHSVH